MATKQILAELGAAYLAQTGVRLEIESVGGVDAARRVQADEIFDVVLLASDAIERLIASGHLVQGSRLDWVHSPVAVAVPAKAAAPDIGSEAALKAAVLAATTISYSTGPSGNYLTGLFARWGIADAVKAKLVVPPPGTPVGSLVARGEAALGFQQLSELQNLEGVNVIGNLPAEVAFITTFSAGIPSKLSPARVRNVKDFLNFLNTPETQPIKLQQGMYPIQ